MNIDAAISIDGCQPWPRWRIHATTCRGVVVIVMDASTNAGHVGYELGHHDKLGADNAMGVFLRETRHDASRLVLGALVGWLSRRNHSY